MEGQSVEPLPASPKGKTPPNLPKGEESQVAGSVGAEQRFRPHQRKGGSVGGDAIPEQVKRPKGRAPELRSPTRSLS